MGSQPSKAHQNEPDYNQGTFEKDKQILIFILLRLFYALIKIVSDEHGNVLNWDTFYEKMSPFFELFCKELGNIEELRIGSINFDVDKRFVVHIELDYATIEENVATKPRLNELSIVEKIREGFFGRPFRKRRIPPQYFYFCFESVENVYDTCTNCHLCSQLPSIPTFLTFLHPANRLRVPAIDLPNNSVLNEKVPTIAFKTDDWNHSFELPRLEDADHMTSIFNLKNSSIETEPVASIEKSEVENEQFSSQLKDRSETKQKRMKLDEELRELRQEQRNRFATLINCILLKHRFEEKEGEWSDWINYSYRAPVLKIINQFGSFQDLTRDAKNFEKCLRESPDDIKSEIVILNEKVSTLLFDLENIFEKLERVNENFKDVLFIQVLQKSVCDTASALFEVFEMLGDVSYNSKWRHELDKKMAQINARDVPTAADLKRICKNPGTTDYSNLEFPQWYPKSSVKIEEIEMCENSTSYSGDSIRSISSELQMDSQTLKPESHFLIESKEKEKSKHVCLISPAVDCLTEDEQEVSKEENESIYPWKPHRLLELAEENDSFPAQGAAQEHRRFSQDSLEVKMRVDLQMKLDEQNRIYEERFKNVRRRREEKNEEAQQEINRIRHEQAEMRRRVHRH